MNYKDLTIKEHIAEMKSNGTERRHIAEVVRNMRRLVKAIDRSDFVEPGKRYTLTGAGLLEVDENGALVNVG